MKRIITYSVCALAALATASAKLIQEEDEWILTSDGMTREEWNAAKNVLNGGKSNRPRFATGSGSTKHMLAVLICAEHFADITFAACKINAVKMRNALRNYGCNCYPENMDNLPVQFNAGPSWHLGFNGLPINELDAACTLLGHRYNCIVLDHDNGFHIDPQPDKNDELKDDCGLFTRFPYFTDDTRNIRCGFEDNPDYVNGVEPEEECYKHVCEIEKAFVYSIYHVFGNDPVAFKNDNVADYNIYDDKSRCHHNAAAVAAPRGLPSPDKCCGVYPFRTSFLSTVRECCDDGEVRTLGSC